jgi:hypothetical protein
MAYSPVSYYMSRGAEYGHTGAGGIAAGKIDVRREEASLEEKYEPARKQLEKSKRGAGRWRAFGDFLKGAAKIAILTGTPIGLGTQIAGGTLYGLSRMAPGVKGGLLGGDIDLPDIAHKYQSTEEMEDVARGAVEGFEESVGFEQAGLAGLGSLFDLYMTQQQKEMMELMKSGDVASLYGGYQSGSNRPPGIGPEGKMTWFGG